MPSAVERVEDPSRAGERAGARGRSGARAAVYSQNDGSAQAARGAGTRPGRPRDRGVVARRRSRGAPRAARRAAPAGRRPGRRRGSTAGSCSRPRRGRRRGPGSRAWVERWRARRASASSSVTSIPPPPVVMSLLPLKLKQPTRPIVPTWRPANGPSRSVAPSASEASSTTGTPWRSAAPTIGSMSAGWPSEVHDLDRRRLPAARRAPALELRRRRAPGRGCRSSALGVDEHRRRARVADRVGRGDEGEVGTRTSSPGPTSSTSSARWIAAVPTRRRRRSAPRRRRRTPPRTGRRTARPTRRSSCCRHSSR